MPHKDLPSYMVMFGACICIILLVFAADKCNIYEDLTFTDIFGK